MENNTKSKLTLIIDGNWLLMSRLSVLKDKFHDDNELCQELKLMLVKSIGVVLRTFPKIDNIIFVADGGSWRNDLPVPEFMTEEYKGNRELDPDTNWKLIFEHYESFMNLLSENGITACKTAGVEGDDWCWYWSQKLNHEGTNVIIWSMDKDLTQLVKTNETNGVFTACWNKSYLTIEEGDYSDGSDLDFFFGDLVKENNQTYLHDLIAKSPKINMIKPNAIVIDKVIRGDKGDNIFPVFVRTAKPSKDGTQSDKTFKVSAKDLDFSLNVHDANAVRQYMIGLLTSKTYQGRVFTALPHILEHFDYNVKLVELNKQNYPTEILSEMEKYTTYNVSKDISNVNSIITAQSNKISNILEII